MNITNGKFLKFFVFILFGTIISSIINKSTAAEEEKDWRKLSGYSESCYGEKNNKEFNSKKCYEIYSSYCKEKTKNVIIIVGSGLFYAKDLYPPQKEGFPYFFINNNKETETMPDIKGQVQDLSSLIPENSADIVIFENIDHDALSPQAYIGAFKSLKKGGRIISSGVPTFVIHPGDQLDGMQSSFTMGAPVIELQTKTGAIVFTLDKKGYFRGFDFKREKGDSFFDILEFKEKFKENIESLKKFIKEYLLNDSPSAEVEILFNTSEKTFTQEEEWPQKEKEGDFIKITKK